MTCSRVLRHAVASCVLAAALSAQTSPFATRVIAFDDMGRAGGGIFNPQNVLGAPDGSVNSLGIGGWITLGFDVVITDGPGADLIVSENAFYSGAPGHSFAEMVFVEVSSDGVTFARFPSAYYGPQQSPGAFGVVNVGAYGGLAGATPVDLLATDPQNVVAAGGDALDLADLRSDPSVVSGAVDLQAITQVRLVDVRDGVDRDSRGVVIRDPGGGSSDPDSVTVIHHTGSVSASGPRVDVVVPADGRFEITFEDPDGWTDLDPATLQTALWGIPVPLVNLLPLMQVTRFDSQGFTVKVAFALPHSMLLRVSASTRDRSGHRSGDAHTRPVN